MRRAGGRGIQPLVSVVTPVYNGARNLAECIESVLGQTYANWEYVIVDNRSTDRSLAIMQEYAAKDGRIRIHANERHLPIMQNWNHALRRIAPESAYVKVVHADDRIFPGCIAEMVGIAERHPGVGIVGSYRLDDTQVNCNGLSCPGPVVPGREVCSDTLRERLYVFGSPTTLLIRAPLVRERERFYNEDNLHADTEVCFDILQRHDFGYVREVLSYTRRGKEAMTCFARQCNTYLPSSLYLLKKYGPVYLPHEEWTRRFEEKMRGYYRFLGKSLLGGRDRRFWQYHRKALGDMGCELSLARLAYYAALELGETLSSPGKSAAKLVKKVRNQAAGGRK